MVKYIVSGQHRLLTVPDSCGATETAILASYFVMSEMPGKAQPHTKDTMQLKLWEVTYIIRGEVRDHIALVLAENKDAALKALVNKVTTFGGAAREVRGPFRDGQVLTTRVTFK